ncbi:MAG: 50S ribosomal protein L25 [Polyangiales bacterium]
METTTLLAEVRASRGKGPARRLRSEGKIPGVFYGPGVEPTPLTLSPKELERALRSERGRNVVFALQVGGKEHLAMVKDLNVDPVTREVLHVDLYSVSNDRDVIVEIPIKTHGRAIGVVKGGMLSQTRRTLPLVTTPDKIPTVIQIDVSGLDLMQTVNVSDIQLEEGVRCSLRPDLTLVAVIESRRVVEEGAEGAAAGGTPVAAAAKTEG